MLTLAVAGLPFDEGPTVLLSVPLVIASLPDLGRGLRTGRWPWRRCGLDLPILCLGLLALLSILWAESPRHTWKLLGRDFGRFVLIAYLVYTHASSRRRLKAIVVAFLTGAAVCAVTGVVERIAYRAVEEYRVYGTFGHPNHCANLMTAALILLLALPAGNRKLLLLRILTALPVIVTLFFTLSRGAWLGTAVACAVLGLLRNRRLAAAGGAVVVLVGCLAILLPSTYIGERIRGMVMPSRFVAALHHRPEIWKGTITLIAESPFLGHGYGHKNFHHAWKRLPDRPDALYGAAHNTPLHIVFELGVLGLLLHVWIFGILLATVIKGFRSAADPLLRALLAALLSIGAGWSLQSLTVEHLLLEQMMVILGGLTGMGLAAARLAGRA